jgi:hypothetical protein
MPWDGIYKRATDKGQEPPEVLLARIDERTENINEKLVAHMVSFETHKVDDDNNFKGLYKTVYMGVGIVLAIQFVILVFKK